MERWAERNILWLLTYLPLRRILGFHSGQNDWSFQTVSQASASDAEAVTWIFVLLMGFLLSHSQWLLWQIKCLLCLGTFTKADVESCIHHTFLSLYESRLLKFICLPMFYSHYSSYLSVHFKISFSLSTGKIQNVLNVVNSWVSAQRSPTLQVRRHWLSHLWILHFWSLTTFHCWWSGNYYIRHLFSRC